MIFNVLKRFSSKFWDESIKQAEVIDVDLLFFEREAYI
jgi:hypothetical protein